MSIENVLNRALSPVTIQREQALAEKGFGSKSPVFIVANAYIKEGCEELRTVSGEVDRKTSVHSGEDFVKVLDLSQRQRLLKGFSCVIMGLSVQGIEDTFASGFFSFPDFAAKYNLAASSTYLQKAESNGEVEQLTLGQQKNMLGFLSKDPTFSTFFTDGFRNLPNKMQSVLQANPLVLKTIREEIVPVYKEQVMDIINARVKANNQTNTT